MNTDQSYEVTKRDREGMVERKRGGKGSRHEKNNFCLF